MALFRETTVLYLKLILKFNAHSKRDELRVLCLVKMYDVICVVESWYSLDSELINPYFTG